jgi:hypothetical protein
MDEVGIRRVRDRMRYVLRYLSDRPAERWAWIDANRAAVESSGFHDVEEACEAVEEESRVL